MPPKRTHPNLLHPFPSPPSKKTRLDSNLAESKPLARTLGANDESPLNSNPSEEASSTSNVSELTTTVQLPGFESESEFNGSAIPSPPSTNKSLSTTNSKPTAASGKQDGNESLSQILTLPPSTLSALSTETLVSYIVTLQQKILAADIQITTDGKKTETKSAEPEIDREKLKKQVDMLANAMGRAIRGQMKWQPKCKTSGKRFTYTSLVPSAHVFYKLFKMDMKTEEGKKWKVKKLTVTEFQRVVGDCTTSIRYGYLRIVSDNVNVKWDRESNSFTVSGMYGL